MDLTFQVPMQYCSLQHRTLLLSPVTSTAGYSFCFGSLPSFFLELFLHWSPVAYWAPTDLGSSSFSVLSFCLFILFMGLSRQEYWNGLPFPSPLHHILQTLHYDHHCESDHMDHSLVQLSETKPCHVGPPKMAGSWWRGLTECGPLEKGIANHFSILALRTPWTVWKGKKIGHWKMNSPGRFSSVQFSRSVVSESLQPHGL